MKRDDEMSRAEAAEYLGITKKTVIYHEGQKSLHPRFDEDEKQWLHTRAEIEAFAQRPHIRAKQRGRVGEGRTDAQDELDLEIFRRLDRGEDGVAIAIGLNVAPRRVAETVALFASMRERRGVEASALAVDEVNGDVPSETRTSDEAAIPPTSWTAVIAAADAYDPADPDSSDGAWLVGPPSARPTPRGGGTRGSLSPDDA